MDRSAILRIWPAGAPHHHRTAPPTRRRPATASASIRATLSPWLSRSTAPSTVHPSRSDVVDDGACMSPRHTAPVRPAHMLARTRRNRQQAPNRHYIRHAGTRANPLRDCDFDGGGAWVEDFSVFGSFDVPVAGAVAFDDAGVGAVSAFAVWVGEDFGFHSLYCVMDLVRGKSRWSLRLRGGLPVGIG